MNKLWKRGRTFYISAFVTLLIVAIQGCNAFAGHAPLAVDWSCSSRTPFPLVAAAICPSIYNSLRISAVPLKVTRPQVTGNRLTTIEEQLHQNTGGLSENYTSVDDVTLKDICMQTSLTFGFLTFTHQGQQK